MEPITQTAVIPIREPSQIALVRRVAADFAQVADLDSQRTSAINIVTVELANNLLQHAGGGEMYIRYTAQLGALDISAVDHGKGMVNVDRCLVDGFSTASTPGLGLGAVRRFATRFAAYSLPDRTTVVSARMSETRELPDFSVISTAIDGETVSGDGWGVSEDGTTFAVVDGLGHGTFAADAAQAALNIFRKHADLMPGPMLEKMHAAMRATRGAAAAIARVDAAGKRIQFAGIGNINCAVMNSTRSQSLVSHNGTLGHQMRRVQQFEYTYTAGDMLIMQSDGLTTHSKKGLPASLLLQPPTIIAPLIFSEQLRGRDDATVLVNRLG